MVETDLLNPAIQSKSELVAYLEAGCKPREAWRIGTEHEKFGFHKDDLTPLPYDGPRGIRAMLEGMVKYCKWQPVVEDGNLIALICPEGGSITLEPGGQFELSGAPLDNIHQTCEEVNRHLKQVQEVGDQLDIGFLGVGFSPKWSLDETPVMPKKRYDIMQAYMPTRGGHGLDMMFRTATVQVNLDFSDEADMVKKFQVSLALQPVATAIFANSPFTEGKPNGFLSYRAEMWRDTDPDRTGLLPFVFEPGMGFERYVDYALQVPMYLITRNGDYIDATSGTFADFLEGRHDQLSGYRPTISDWETHLTTLFPEVRLKRFLEMRGADGGPWRKLCALPALWTGLLYDQTALDAAFDLIKDWTAEEHSALRDSVPRLALKTPFRSGKLRDVAQEMVAIAKQGLQNRNRLDEVCGDERHFLSDVERIVADGVTRAERLLELYHGEWGGDISRLFKDMAY